MVNTAPKENEGTPEVNPGRRKFLKGIGLTVAASVATALGISECDKLTEKKVLERVKNTNTVTEIKDFDNSMNVALENLLNAYESLEFDVAKKYYTDNYKNADLNLLINLSIAITNLRIEAKNDNIQKRIDNMFFKFNMHGNGNHGGIEMKMLYSDFYTKKYPQLIPVIEEWKKKNGK